MDLSNILYVIEEDAERDIDKIYPYSIERHGLEQTEKYIRDLHQAFERISTMPSLGKPIGKEGIYRRVLYGEHVIVYKKNIDSPVAILAIYGQVTEWEEKLKDRLEA